MQYFVIASCGNFCCVAALLKIVGLGVVKYIVCLCVGDLIDVLFSVLHSEVWNCRCSCMGVFHFFGIRNMCF